MEKYAKELIKLNDSEAFQSLMSYDEDKEKMIRTDKKLAYEDGVAENKIETAKKLLSKDMNYDFIHEITGLSIDEINKLSNEL